MIKAISADFQPSPLRALKTGTPVLNFARNTNLETWQRDSICLRFSGTAPKKSSWAKTLGAGLLGLVSLLPMAGCTSNTQKMEQAYQKIPVVQVENRLNFLKEQLNHKDAYVQAKAVEHIGELRFDTTEQLSILLKALDSTSNIVAFSAESALSKAILGNTTVSSEVKQPLQEAIANRPWVESYEVFSHFMMIPNGDGGFIYIPVYDTHYQNHGNAEKYQEARQQLDQWLEAQTKS